MQTYTLTMNLREVFRSVKPTNLQLRLAALLRTPTLPNRTVQANRLPRSNDCLGRRYYYPCCDHSIHCE